MSSLRPSHNVNLTGDLSGQVSNRTMNLHTSTISPYTLSQPSALHIIILRRTNLAARDVISNREKTPTKQKLWWHQTHVSSSGASTRDNPSPQKQDKEQRDDLSLKTYQFLASSASLRYFWMAPSLPRFLIFLPSMSYPICSSALYHSSGTSPTVFLGATYTERQSLSHESQMLTAPADRTFIPQSSGLGDASTEKASFSPRPRRNRSLPPPRPRPLTRRSPRRCLRGTANPVAGAKPTHARVSGVARTGGFAAYYQATGEERNWRSEKNTHLVVLGRPDAVAPRRVVGGEVVPLVVPVAVPHSRRRKASLAPAAEDEGGRWRMGGGAG
jgi:hypothetical protein